MKNICGKYMKNREQKIDTVVLIDINLYFIHIPKNDNIFPTLQCTSLFIQMQPS